MSARRLDPVTLSVLSSALSGIAEEMGAVLIRGAYSSNIKERRDCSAALFDAEGRMVAQAERKVLAAVGRPGTAPGEFGEAHFIAISPRGEVYVADSVNGMLMKFVKKK